MEALARVPTPKDGQGRPRKRKKKVDVLGAAARTNAYTSAESNELGIVRVRVSQHRGPKGAAKGKENKVDVVLGAAGTNEVGASQKTMRLGIIKYVLLRGSNTEGRRG